jgi:glucose/arabinose dehydrogenase
MLAFGPDGRLYVALGDGGGGGDTYQQGQRADTLLATITAVNVDGPQPTTSLFAYGLRNPWRFSFDGMRVYIGDVGQGSWEEIDVLSTFDAGANLGWSIMEGAHCFGTSTCSTAGLVLPVTEYSHAGGACSVTGGYVYRGTAMPELEGHYLYGDFCAGWIRSFRYTGVASDARTWGISVGGLTSFGTDGFGEMYVTSTDGVVRKIVKG